MQRSLEWARGRLIIVPAADLLLRDIAEYIAEVNGRRQHEQQQGRLQHYKSLHYYLTECL